MAILYQTAKFISAHILAMAVLRSTAKFNSRQCFRPYGIRSSYMTLYMHWVTFTSSPLPPHTPSSHTHVQVRTHNLELLRRIVGSTPYSEHKHRQSALTACLNRIAHEEGSEGTKDLDLVKEIWSSYPGLFEEVTDLWAAEVKWSCTWHFCTCIFLPIFTYIDVFCFFFNQEYITWHTLLQYYIMHYNYWGKPYALREK